MAEIQVTDEQGNIHIFPDGSTPEMMAKVLNVKPPQPSLDLSNKQGQGTYQMAGPDGKAVGVPYGQVQQAATSGYQFASDADKFRFAKDNAADPHRTTQFAPAAGDPRANPAYQQQMERNLPAPMQVVAGMAKGGGTLAAPFLHAVAAATGGNPQDVSDMLTAHGGLQTAAKVGTIGAAVVPAAVAAPIATATGLAGGAIGAGAGQAIGSATGMSPNGTQLLSDALGVAGGVSAGYGGSKISDAIPQIKAYLRPPTSPSVVPRTEMAARQLSAAILPANKDAANFIQAAQQEVPNVLSYAQKTGNPLNTQLEFSKAAQGYAQEVRSLYEKDVLGPVANKSVETTGTSFGTTMRQGESPTTAKTFATLGDIDARIGKINTQLDAPAMNSDDSRRALASKESLQQEAAQLRTILHNNLAESSGLSPEEIANLRQRVGRSYELANDTNAAVTQRMQSVGKSELGPVKLTQLPSRAIEFARGGPVPIADRQFQRAIANFPGQASPLPTVAAPPAAQQQIDRLEQLLSIARRQQNVNRWNSEKF